MVTEAVQSDVLVVGGGPAGASTAWHLARLGVSVTLLDRARFPRDKVCAEYLSPEASRILDQMGALEAIDAAGAARLDGMKVRAPGGGEIVGHFSAPHGFRGFRDVGMAVRRTTLDATLLDCARRAGAHVMEGVRATDVVRDATGRVTGVRVQDDAAIPGELRAQLVIGADGLRSVIARRLGLIRTLRAPRRIALVAHYRGLTGVGTVGEMHVERDGYVGIADVGNGLTNVALVVPLSRTRDDEPGRHTHRNPAFDGRAFGGDPTQFFERWLARRPQLASRFAHAERVDPVRVTGPFASVARQPWAPGAALVGDAADFFDPFTGEGIYSALRGGELLAPIAAEYLRATTPSAGNALLREYERARRREFSGKWTVERIIATVVGTPALIDHAARALSRRRDMADLLIGVVGDFVPPREVLRFGYIARLLLFGI